MEELLLKLSGRLSRALEEIDKLKERVRDLEGRVPKRETYTQTEVAELTGWSTSAVNNWVKDRTIVTISGTGRNLMIPASEVDRIFALKGKGPRYKQAS
jgi:hypothetical protein